jgi:hypothetical protein
MVNRTRGPKISFAVNVYLATIFKPANGFVPSQWEIVALTAASALCAGKRNFLAA